VSFSFPKVKECAAGGPPFGPNPVAACTLAASPTLIIAATHVIPRIRNLHVTRGSADYRW